MTDRIKRRFFRKFNIPAGLVLIETEDMETHMHFRFQRMVSNFSIDSAAE